jgi:hypothetical protein
MLPAVRTVSVALALQMAAACGQSSSSATAGSSDASESVPSDGEADGNLSSDLDAAVTLGP